MLGGLIYWKQVFAPKNGCISSGDSTWQVDDSCGSADPKHPGSVFCRYPKSHPRIPSGKLTWQWNIPSFNRKYIFKGSIFRCYVSLPECTKQLLVSWLSQYWGPHFFVKNPTNFNMTWTKTCKSSEIMIFVWITGKCVSTQCQILRSNYPPLQEVLEGIYGPFQYLSS